MALPASSCVEPARERTTGQLDRVAIGLSTLCLFHCVATVLLAATMASIGATLSNPVWHEMGFTLAILIGAIALGRGYLSHRNIRPLLLGLTGLALMGVGLARVEGVSEILSTMTGVILLALAHRLNARGHTHGLVGGRRRA